MSSNASKATFPVLWRHAGEVGIRGLVEVDESEFPNGHFTGATVGDLLAMLNTKLDSPGQATEREIRGLFLYGTQLPGDRALESLVPRLSTCCPRLVVVTRATTPRLYRPTTISDDCAQTHTVTVVLTTTQHEDLVAVVLTMDETVGQLKKHLEDLTSIPRNEQRLVCAGRRLQDDAAIVQTVVPRGIKLYLAKGLCGGGDATSRRFVDVSNQSLLSSVAFTETAPSWRTVTRGLNIEGICMSPGCEAYRHQVIHQVGFASFNLLQDRMQCPSCHVACVPRTCGFWDCVWKFDGVRARDKCLVSSPWIHAEGESMYHCFDKSQELIGWESLLIVAKPPFDDLCSICFTKRESQALLPVSIKACAHAFHRLCLETWARWCESTERVRACPVCHLTPWW